MDDMCKIPINKFGLILSDSQTGIVMTSNGEKYHDNSSEEDFLIYANDISEAHEKAYSIVKNKPSIYVTIRNHDNSFTEIIKGETSLLDKKWWMFWK
jgi:c-di-AMP phosphodiesterase-like protein